MRVGILTSVGGTLDAFFYEIVREWESRGHRVFCASGSAPVSPFCFDLIDGLSQRPGPNNLLVPWRIASWARARQLDVVVINTATASTLARIPRMPCKIVYFCHGLHWNEGWHPAQVVEHVLARRCDSILAINTDDYAWFARRHGHVRLLREGVGVPDDGYLWSPIPTGDRLRLIWAGDFAERKRPLDAVRVAARLSEANFDYHLLMLGDGPLREETVELALALGLRDRISFPGQRPVEEPLRASHAVLHTSAWEGLPRILLEGLVMGRRAFAFDVKGVRDVPDAVLAPDGDVSTLADLIIAKRHLLEVDRRETLAFRTSEVAHWLETYLEEVLG